MKWINQLLVNLLVALCLLMIFIIGLCAKSYASNDKFGIIYKPYHTEVINGIVVDSYDIKTFNITNIRGRGFYGLSPKMYINERLANYSLGFFFGNPGRLLKRYELRNKNEILKFYITDRYKAVYTLNDKGLVKYITIQLN